MIKNGVITLFCTAFTFYLLCELTKPLGPQQVARTNRVINDSHLSVAAGNNGRLMLLILGTLCLLYRRQLCEGVERGELFNRDEVTTPLLP
jgi:hypothetical protein